MTPRVRAAWARRTAAEYRSAAVASELLHWSIALGVPPVLIDELHRLVRDELHHADLSREVHHAAGGRPAEVAIPRDELFLRICRSERLERRAVAAALHELALHESIALALFQVMRKAPLEPIVCATLGRIARDEARHRRLGWQLLRTLLTQTGERDWLRSIVPELVDGLKRSYHDETDDLTAAETAWGLLDGAASDSAVRKAVAGYVAVNLARQGLVCHA